MHDWTVWNPFFHQSAKATAFATDVLTGSNPMHRAQRKTVPLRGPFPIQWWAMRDVRVRLRRPRPASGLRPSRAALENASRFLSSAPCRVRIPLRWAQTKTVPFRGPFPIQWWAMRDVRVRLAPPAPRFVAPLLACCAGKRFAFPQLRTLSGSNPSAMGPKTKGPHSWEPIKSVVGDEGFEPPALCV